VQELLARDVMKRVEVDNARNSRLPRSITVGYTIVPGGAWIGRTFRLPFPTDRDFNSRVRKLVDGTRKALSEKGHSGLIRIGFSAVDFVVRSRIGIDSFFGKGVKANAALATKHAADGNSDVKKGSCPDQLGREDSFLSSLNHASASPETKIMPFPTVNGHDKNERGECPSPVKNPTGKCYAEVSLQEMNSVDFDGYSHDNTPMLSTSPRPMQNENTVTDEDIARRLQGSLDEEMKEEENSSRSIRSDIIDKDEALALVLQSTYDREDALLSHMERFSTRKKDNDTKPRKSGNKRSKIDFFLKK
jgi:hypothetical protein